MLARLARATSSTIALIFIGFRLKWYFPGYSRPHQLENGIFLDTQGHISWKTTLRTVVNSNQGQEQETLARSKLLTVLAANLLAKV
jgi:hypothetical protein